MLSYRHIFHAGNHADMLKHMVLCVLLRDLNKKDKPYSVIDTHSGAGLYKLSAVNAQKTGEYKSGIEKIRFNERLQKLVPEYFSVLNKLNSEESQDLYPGSPYIEQSLIRQDDKLTLIDLHPTEAEALKSNFGRDRRINIQNRDGLQAMSALLPPTPRRGMAFIDPAYEEKNDYYELVKAVKAGLQRWSTGIYAVWYPVLAKLKDHSKNLAQDLKRLNLPLLQAELQVEEQNEDFGMCGSGMLILNYPFGIDAVISDILDELYNSLADKKYGSAKLKILTPRP